MNNTSKQFKPHNENNLKLRYGIALGCIAFMAIMGFGFIYHSLVQQSEDANLISISSRQRFHVQQMNNILDKMPVETDTSDFSILYGRVQTLLGMLENYHSELDISTEGAEDGTPMADARRILEMAFPELQQMQDKIRRLGEAYENPNVALEENLSPEKLIRFIRLRGAAYSESLDEFAHTYTVASKARIEYIKQLEVYVLLILLAILVLEGLFVFRPTIKKLYQVVAERGIAIKSLESEIKEHKASQAKLEQSEQELRGLFNNVHDSIIIYNLTDHTILEVNERACEIYGYSREEFLTMRIEAITKKPSRIARCVKETLNSGTSTHFEMVQLRKDGRERLMDANTSIVKYKGERAILSIYQDISEKRLAEVALRSSEEKYSNLFQFSNDCIIIYDLAGRLLDCNEQVLTKFGIIDAEVTSLNISRFYPREQHALLTSATADLIRKGYVRFEIDVVSKNGTIWPAEVSANLFRMNNKKVVQAVFRDITERKEAERRQQALYRIAEITTFSDDMDEFYAAIHAVVGQLTYAENFYIALYDENTQTLDCPYFVDEYDSFPAPRNNSDGLTEYAIRGGKPLRLSREELTRAMNEKKFKVFGELAVEWAFVPFIRGGEAFGGIVVQSYNQEIRFNQKDLELLSFVGQHIASAIDRKRSLEELSSERERLKVTMNSISDGVITTDVENCIMFMNPAAEGITGVSYKEAIGRNIMDVLYFSTEKNRDTRLNPSFEVLRTGRTIEYPHLLLQQISETTSIIGLSVAPINDESDNTTGTVLAFRDITEQQKTEQEMQKILKLESVGLLAGGIAHDFNNMLTAIIGNVALAKIDSGISAETIVRLKEAEIASNRAKDLTRQLLTFSKGGAPIKKTASVKELVHETVQFTLVGSKISCEYSFPDDLWPIEADKGQISQVINNIVINALHEMKNEGKLHVDCKNFPIRYEMEYPHYPMPPGNYLQLRIADEGNGIPEEIRSRIFDPYFTTKEEGSGLGLATCFSIISNHEGYIGVDSVEGEGTIFTILLPAVPDKEAINEEAEERMQTGEGRVLIMDDEESIRNLVGQMLKRLGYSVESAADGNEAIELYKKALELDQRYDAVIMDLTIPGGMGGKDAIVMLREIDPDVNAIVSSGYSNDPIMSDYRAYGFTACVAKPFNLHDIGSALRNSVYQTKLSSHSASES